MSRQRLSNYELLRVISMVLIVYHHFAVHSHWPFDKEHKDVREIFLDIVASGGKVGVDLFMMLTGYFLAGRPAKVASVVRSWIQVLTYSWGIFFILYFQRGMGYRDVMESIFPVFYFAYWFVTTYMVVVLLSPALGKMAANMTHAEYIGMLSVLFMTLCILNYTFGYAYSHVFYFAFLFLLGSYFRLFQSAYAKVKTRTYFIVLMGLLFFNVFTIYYFSVNQYEWVNHHGGAYFLMISNSAPLALFISIFTFLFVGRLEFWSPPVNVAASVAFGIYLIHDNRFLRNLIWNHWIRGEDHYDNPEFYIYCLVAPGFVYAICGSIEWLRQRYLGRVDVLLAAYIEKIVLLIGQWISYHLGLAEDPASYYELETTPATV